MFFKSDNSLGVPEVMFEALKQANEGATTAYGGDPWTEKVKNMFCDLFEREVAVFMVATGTAANALSISALTPTWGAVVCHEESHLMVSECGASEFFTGGAKLIGVAGENGKLTPEGVIDGLYNTSPGDPHSIQPATISLTQATEKGTVYTLDEIATLCVVAKSQNLKVHMDGARFANAVVSLGCSAAEMTWKAGIDVLSFGATKNGAMAAEAVVMFDLEKAEEVKYRRMRAGHLLSKNRFPAAQLIACLEDDLWLKNATHANAMARRLATGLRDSNKLRHAFDVEANMQFVIMQPQVHEQLVAGGAEFHAWPNRKKRGENAKQEEEIIARLVCGFSTKEEDVDAFVRLAGSVK